MATLGLDDVDVDSLLKMPPRAKNVRKPTKSKQAHDIVANPMSFGEPFDAALENDVVTVFFLAWPKFEKFRFAQRRKIWARLQALQLRVRRQQFCYDVRDVVFTDLLFSFRSIRIDTVASRHAAVRG